MMSKVLARTRDNVGTYVLRNADNLMYFAYSTFYSKNYLGGDYQSRPFAQNVPTGSPYDPHGSALRFDGGVAQVQNADALAVFDVNSTGCGSTPTNFEGYDPVNITTVGVHSDSDYPADYLSKLASWRSTAAAATATATSNPTSSPVPTCHSSGTQSVDQRTAQTMITGFCLDPKNLAKTISNENPIVDEAFPYNTGSTFSGLVWLSVSFGEQNCMGSFTIDTNKCNTRLSQVLNGCDTNSITAKHGGNITDGCAVYSMSLVETKTSADPAIPDYSQSRGTYSCVDT